MNDAVVLDELRFSANVGLDCWARLLPQPVSLNIRLVTDLTRAASSDSLPHTVHYGELAESILESAKTKHYSSPYALVKEVSENVYSKSVTHSNVTLTLPKALLHGTLKLHKYTDGAMTLEIADIFCNTVIGVYPFERLRRQSVVVSVILKSLAYEHADHSQIADSVFELVESSEFQTVEALAEHIADSLQPLPLAAGVQVSVRKPSAVAQADCAGVSVLRPNTLVNSHFERHTAYLALGSNLGNRFENIKRALDTLKSPDIAKLLDNTLTSGEINVTQVSALYETKPMYYLDQPTFVNGVARIETTFTPQELLKVLKIVESNVLSRVKTIRNGPRTVDLDILLYDGAKIDIPPEQGDLIVPHQRMLERLFVLCPLLDLCPNGRHPVEGGLYSAYAAQLKATSTDPPPNKALGLSDGRVLSLGHKTYIMAILNATPDSFSDGGALEVGNLREKVQQYIEIAGDALIVDVGGQSTHPKSTQISAEEESGRVVPVIKALREAFPELPISVDTYYGAVAKDALEAGADIVNDVSGGTIDVSILDVVAAAGCPYVLMHMRGTPQTMKDHVDYDDVVETIGKELEEKIKNAEASGIYRYNIILDPGYGFAKTGEQSLELIRRHQELEARPGLQGVAGWLSGPSRKGFIGSVTGKTVASERDFGTGAAVTSSIEKGFDIVRVHAVDAMTDVVKVADSLYR
ncbi:hypothetical protein CANCADRAFT_146155 [Tortispora caseinolytica NRRL Y-17796]|uniref:Folic acid synthesis protein FOL1 n=1 Tax=Tortispora caseinolytica NRRL Y-17796 TaxID=767744 RepID=A0A1E4T9L7_9ASCO|nr:hypothetical protein CANCADRAFT_146155 [Tortispora caseinolytica NRRL Y-17796]